MKFASIGFGGMGRAIRDAAVARGHAFATKIDAGDEWDFGGATVVFEATTPDAVRENISKLCAEKKDVVVATTGWYDDLPAVRAEVEAAGIRFLWSSNFSVGVNLFFRVVEVAAKLFENADEFDVWATEIHHRNKIDSPSGTAKILEKILLKNLSRKTAVVEEKLNRRIEPHELHFSSTRGGESNFGHTVCFDSAADAVKIEHFARNRDGYALGAVKCAEWLVEQSPGFYSMEDFLLSTFFQNE